MTDILAVFNEEANEHLIALEEGLLNFDPSEPDQAIIDALFRSMHTIKGSSGMLGLNHLADFTHHLESLLEQVRGGHIALNADHIRVLLACNDHISALIKVEHVPDDLLQQGEQLLSELLGEPIENSDNVEVSPEHSQHGDGGETNTLWSIKIVPHMNTFKEGFDLLPILREIEELGSMQAFPALRDTQGDALACAYMCLILLESTCELAQIKDVFMFVEDDWQIEINAHKHPQQWQLLQEALAKLDNNARASALSQPNTADNIISMATPTPASVKPSKTPATSNKANSQDESFVKVPTNKLDTLMNLVGELVIVKAKLDALVPQIADARLDDISEEFARLSQDLRENAFDMRMLPIGTIFSRFKRVVRDTSDKLNKQVELVLSGQDTELDKLVLDRLADPLIHLVRNSLDHGIEMPEQRLNSGKSALGKISINAGHSDGYVLIEVSDDGAGLDLEKIRQKAIANKIIDEDQNLSEQEIYQLIFAPGFSTADKVSDISGRGVGMDVVKTSIAKLQGRVEISSVHGQGTNLRIYLPMTLAIIEGLNVRVGDEQFVIPLNIVEECIETPPAINRADDGGITIEHRDKVISTIRLRNTFNIRTEQSTSLEQTVIIKQSDSLIGITVDEVIGQSQTVIKSLGQLYAKTPGFMGATVLGDGRVAMIIDVPQLANDARSSLALH